MCGRFTQTESVRSYAQAIGVALDALDDYPSQPIAAYNGAPGARHWIFRLADDGDGLSTQQVPWGYLSPWAKKKGLQPAINAQREKLLTPYYRPLMKSGRIIVPANGWYEWTGPKGQRQPWYIRRRDGRPLFMAALTSTPEREPAAEGAGFVIVTSAAEGGMVDVHDRRPVVLAADDARIWMSLDTPLEQAEQMARIGSLPATDFEWHRVSPAVNNARHNAPELIEPLPQ
ncbi:MAG: SOS response-associated peptidase family protein [Burkholderiaceae bacterium]